MAGPYHTEAQWPDRELFLNARDLYSNLNKDPNLFLFSSYWYDQTAVPENLQDLNMFE